MTYSLGIDLGTTYSAAAVVRNERASIVELGRRSASVPSVVFLRDDESVIAGDAAERRAATEPQRVAREFKRRLGDTTPLLLGGTPYSAEALTARLLAWIVDQVVEREGGPPVSIAITHPANWGPYKTDLLQQAVRLAGLDPDKVTLITEPEAAVRHYASQERVEPGSVVAVYDLGGGTFDAALLRKTDSGFESLGRPEGIERLGGIDFDAAVLGHVVRALDGTVEALDPDEPGARAALARLRHECVDAKEALSSDTETSIPVLLPNVQTEVRLTRAEFESMIRPSLADSLDALRRALSSADTSTDDVSAVLLVGGSSRVPLVAQLVSNEFGRPVAIDADPKHAVALGAALVAAAALDESASESSASAAIAGAGAAAGVAAAGSGAAAAADVPTEAAPVVDPAATTVTPAADAPTTPVAAVASTAQPSVVPPADLHADAPPAARSRLPLVLGIAAAVVALAVTGVIVLSGSGGGDSTEAGAATVTEPVGEADTATSAAPVTTPDDTTPAPAETSAATVAPVVTDAPEAPDATVDAIDIAALPTPCPADQPFTACITAIEVDAAGGLVATYVTTGYEPELEPVGDHIHFFFDSVIAGNEANAGTAGNVGEWRVWDAPNPFTATGGEQGRTGYTIDDARLFGATQLCSLAADVNHAVYEGTGNCIAIPGL